ncbi:S-adenosyl-L-methionine-dependent methyltransferase [Cercophora newfieldiana]|uniref:S-adenosyl-L-methionine-dependent methyltransferase n=1 Tax=Cercophora newfieldiana TaxID=92897 RepID=A0AA39Y918_9PEZI|nr:S-adenosyl-L-methionine-dependent methyltransferase [Cercophora newfieldiana]
MVNLEWLMMTDIATWRLFMEWKAFDHIPVGGSVAISDLAQALGAQESLVARLANFLVATGRLRSGEIPGHIRHSRVSPLYMSSHPVSDLNAVAIGNGFKSWLSWPEYFERYGRREAPDVTHTPFSFAWGHPELPPWEVKALYPEYAAQFARTMKSRQIVGGDMKLTGPAALYDFSWLAEEAKGRGANEPVVVDVGGGLGQLLRDLLAAVPGVSGRQCILQDRKEVLEEAAAVGDAVLDDVVMMEHDFHTKQPVRGASVYLVRRILLDYPDALATGILKQLADALPADNPRARVIIMEEQLLTPPTPHNRSVDMMMLSIGGKLRDEKAMRSVAAQAGLSIKYHARPGDPTCVVECWRA